MIIAAKGIILNGGDGGGDGDGLEGGTTIEGTIPNGGDTERESDRLKGCAVSKGPITNRSNGGGDGDGLEGAAVSKGTTSDRCDGGGDYSRRATNDQTIVRGSNYRVAALPAVIHWVRGVHFDRCQGSAIRESATTKGTDGGGDGYGFQRRAAGESEATDGGDGGGDGYR